jgi:DNA-binding LacI/PurR family transcriptional regulator
MFCATEGVPEREQGAVELMLDNRVSGLVFLSFLDRPGQIGATIDGRVPSVFIAAEETWTDSVTVDELHGGEIVASHLAQLGHRRLAFVGPHHRDQADSRRLEGFVRAARDAGLEPLIVGWDPPEERPSIGTRRTDWREILCGERAVTGVFAANDFAAIDLLDVADALGVRVPAQLSVVGFDDVDMARLRRISLTTVSQPRAELVRLGVEALLGRIDGSRDGATRVTRLGVALQIRGSTGPAR